MRVLIVEDDVLLAYDVETTLRDAGHEVLGPASTAEAAYCFAQHHPDLALLDIRLLDGATGPEIGRELRRRWNIPSLFLTASQHEAMQNQDAALGLLLKPIVGEDLIEAIAVIEDIANGGRMDGTELPPALRLFGR
jgi:two-component system, response regulator PdtaR